METDLRLLFFILTFSIHRSCSFPSRPNEDLSTVLAKFANSGSVAKVKYDFNDDIQKGLLGEYDVKNEDAFRNEDGSRLKDHSLSTQQFSDKNEAVLGSKGEKFVVEGKFDKGSKTSGFHNVHHKEEYKKNREFYDVAQKSGSYRRYGDFGAVLLAAAKDSKNDVRLDKDHRQLNYGSRGRNGKGSLYEKLQKYGAGNGQGQFYRDNLNFFDVAQVDND